MAGAIWGYGGGPGYGYCLYVSKLSKHPDIAFKFLDAMASQPNAFIKQGYHQPRMMLSNGQPGLEIQRAVPSKILQLPGRRDFRMSGCQPQPGHLDRIVSHCGIRIEINGGN